MRRSLLLLIAALFAFAVAAAPIVHRDRAEEKRFRALVSELRCVMCQNQSLADSNAGIAHDLRLEVLRLMREGKSDAQIKQYLVERYSEFVLYRPQVKPMTWALWFGPALIVAAGAVVIVLIVRKQSTRAPRSPAPDDNQEW